MLVDVDDIVLSAGRDARASQPAQDTLHGTSSFQEMTWDPVYVSAEATVLVEGLTEGSIEQVYLVPTSGQSCCEFQQAAFLASVRVKIVLDHQYTHGC